MADIDNLVIVVNCGLSFCLNSFSTHRHLWKVLFNRILCNFCISLAFVNILVLVVTEVSTGSDACLAAAVLLHYFVLATFSWSVVQALNLHQTIVKVFSGEIDNFMKKAVLFGWGEKNSHANLLACFNPIYNLLQLPCRNYYKISPFH